MENNSTSFADIEAALSLGFRPQRFELLRRVTDLFVANAATCSQAQIDTFDEIMEKLVERIERASLIELSQRLAPLPVAPINVCQRLSRDEDIEIAQAMLEKSAMLTEAFLVEIARTQSQAHLAAIAGRREIGVTVTDVLIDRGDRHVAQKVVANAGARFSAAGHTTVAQRAMHDEDMAELFIARADIPRDIFELLVREASETVRRKLLARATPDMRDRIISTVASVSQQVARIDDVRPPAATASGARVTIKNDPAQMRAQVSRMIRAGRPMDAIEAFAALSGLSSQMMSGLVRQRSDETLAILAKAVGIGWPDVRDLLTLTMKDKLAQGDRSKTLFNAYAALTPENAQRILRFARTSRTFSGNDLQKLM